MLTKTVIGNRIKALRLEKGLSQEEFGEPLKLSRSALSQIESGLTFPSLETLDRLVYHYSLSWDDLMLSRKQSSSKRKETEVKTLVTTVDNSGKDNIVLVPVKAQAGYLLGYQQPEFIETLPTFWLPGLSHGTFRAFEVNGYSMLSDRVGFFPGDIVVGEYVERLEDIKDGQVYVIVNDAQEVDDIVLKRCLNYMKDGLIICKSDNKDPQYPTFPLQAENIKEVWRFKIKLTRQAPEPSGLNDRVNHLEGDIALLKDQLKKLLSK
ncbi:MAG: XRE family transcriptional regulator [Bacteroidota bacterium]